MDRPSCIVASFLPLPPRVLPPLLPAPALLQAKDGNARQIPIGLDGHSMRSMRFKRWKATQLIEFAAEQQLDAVLFNGLHYFESLETGHLRNLSNACRPA